MRDDFDALHSRVNDHAAFAYAFDLLMVDDADIRRLSLANRRAHLSKLLRNAKPGVRLSEHIAVDGATVFRHACKLAFEGIVSKRVGCPLPLGPWPDLDQGQEQASPRLPSRSGRYILRLHALMPRGGLGNVLLVATSCWDRRPGSRT